MAATIGMKLIGEDSIVAAAVVTTIEVIVVAVKWLAVIISIVALMECAKYWHSYSRC